MELHVQTFGLIYDVNFRLVHTNIDNIVHSYIYTKMTSYKFTCKCMQTFRHNIDTQEYMHACTCLQMHIEEGIQTKSRPDVNKYTHKHATADTTEYLMAK